VRVRTQWSRRDLPCWAPAGPSPLRQDDVCTWCRQPRPCTLLPHRVQHVLWGQRPLWQLSFWCGARCALLQPSC
jgi:hypothetical protein